MKKVYLMTKDKSSNLKNHIKFNNYYLHYNDISVTKQTTKHSAVIMLGTPIDITDPEKSTIKIVEELVESLTVQEVLKKSKKLLGRFLIFFSDSKKNMSVLPDATCSIPIYYIEKNSDIEISSTTYILSKKHNLNYSEEAKRIRAGAETQQPLPYNLTMYDEIKILIPNHYFDMSNGEMIRFYPIEKVEEYSLEQAVSETIRVMDNVIPYIVRTEDIAIPITAGLDSRLLLALFREYIDTIPLYTFFDKGDEDNWDIKVPKDLAETFNLDYFPLERLKMSEDNYNKLSQLMDGQENPNVLTAGFTLSESPLRGRRNMPGDILPLAKSNFGKNLPESFATTSYLVTKTHNYSKENRHYVKKWKKSASNNAGVSIYDLFFWEYRLGRWFTKSVANYDLLAQPYYLFNNRYLIEIWLGVSRKERTEKSFHEEIIKIKWPDLLQIPINPGEPIKDKVFKNQYAYYLGVFLKYYLKKVK